MPHFAQSAEDAGLFTAFSMSACASLIQCIETHAVHFGGHHFSP